MRRVKKKRVREKRRDRVPRRQDVEEVRQGRADSPIATRGVARTSTTSFASLYSGVKAIKPTMLVGISPFGIWRPGRPPGVTGLDAYSEIYADSRRWLAEGWLDYIVPQLYWQVGGYQDRFRAARRVVAIGESAGPSHLAGSLHLARLRRLRRVADRARFASRS